MSEEAGNIGTLIDKIESDGRPIQDWTREELDGYGTLLFYESIEPELNGFRFCATRMIAESGENRWYRVMAEGYGFFDGLRHIWWHPAEAGYEFYPVLEQSILILRRLVELEQKFCRCP